MTLKLIVSFLLGSLLVLAFEPFNFWLVACIIPISTYFLIKKINAKDSFFIGWVFGLGLWVFGIFWIQNSIHNYGGADEITSILITLLLAIFLSLFFAFTFFLFSLLKKNNSFDLIFLFPSVWVLGEWLREFFFSGFPWLYLGYTTLDNFFFSGFIPLIGIFGVSFFMLFIPANIILLITSIRNNYFNNLIIFSLLSVILFFGSSFFLYKKDWTEEYREVDVVVVQPNISIQEKWSTQGEKESLKLFESILLKESNQVIKEEGKVKFIFFPEAFLPGIFSDYEKTLNPLLALTEKVNLGVIVGTLTNKEGKSKEINNSLISFGALEGQFDKQRLVPFGEYVPLPFFNYFFDFFDFNRPSIQASQNNSLIKSSEINISSAICYEIAYQDTFLKHAKKSNLLFNASNDNWFGDSIGPHQHLQIARFRASEQGKPLIRSTSTGISAIINRYGEVIESTAIDVEALRTRNHKIINKTIISRKGQTPFSVIGKTPILLLMSFIIICFLSYKLFFKNEKN